MIRSDDQAQFIYQKQWSEYKDRNGKIALIVTVLIVCIFTAITVANIYAELMRWLNLAIIIVMALVAFIFLVLQPLPKKFACPGCGSNFDPYKGINLKSSCVNCGLPRYFGSTYFRDYWGADRAMELTENSEWIDAK
jgi:hypothetical protein